MNSSLYSQSYDLLGFFPSVFQRTRRMRGAGCYGNQVMEMKMYKTLRRGSCPHLTDTGCAGRWVRQLARAGDRGMGRTLHSILMYPCTLMWDQNHPTFNKKLVSKLRGELPSCKEGKVHWKCISILTYCWHNSWEITQGNLAVFS